MGVSGGLSAQEVSSAPVNFEADDLFYDEQRQIVMATGNVTLTQSGRTLRASQVMYYQAEDRVVARGRVVLTEPDGMRYSAHELELEDELREGTVTALSGTFPDSSRFAATRARRLQDPEKGEQLIFDDAIYTACAACEEDPNAPPVWQIRADKVTHHRDEQRVSYNNATFDVGGVPVLWVPYFSHPDGSVDRKSGFIDPVVGYDSRLGAFAGAKYYYAIDPYQDATIGLTAYTKEAPLLDLEYRRRFSTAYIRLEGGATYSDRIDRTQGEERRLAEEARGYLFAEGQIEFNEKWRAGMDLELSSDDQFLRQYDINEDDILENEFYLERFSGRNYAVARALAFQDVRIFEDDDPFDQPNILPEIEVSFIGKPNSLLGGRGELSFSALGLQREGDEPDQQRISGGAGWKAHGANRFGLVTTAEAQLRGDTYYLTDQSQDPDADNRTEDSRLYAAAKIDVALPVAKPLRDGTRSVIITPQVGVTGAYATGDADDIPNEDSQDAFLEPNNLFNLNRFPGFNRIEEESRVTYGLRAGLYDLDGSELSIFAGQSYAFDDSDNSFPEGSGLADQGSDVVAELRAAYRDRVFLNYRTQIDNDNLTAQRHEVDANLKAGPVDMRSTYFFSKALDGTSFDESREQLRGALRLQLSDQWAAETGAIYDLGEDPGLREGRFGLIYASDCFTVSTYAERQLNDDASGESGTELFIRIGLRNLGNFETSGISLDDGSGSSTR